MQKNYNIELGKRLKTLRTTLDLEQTEFGEHIGKGRNTIISWEKGRTSPTDTMLSLIATTLGCSERWLSTGRGEMLTKPISEILKNIGTIKGDSNYVTVKVLTMAGLGNSHDEEHYEPIDTIQFERNSVTKNGKIVSNAVKAEGDSMYPTIVDGGIVGIDFEDKRVIDNGIFLIRFPDVGIAIKRLQIKTGGILAVGDNSQVEPELIPKDILQQGLILGRIRWIHNKV